MRRGRVQWQDESGDRPAHWILLQMDPSAVGFDKLFANGKPEAKAIG